jgi:chaperonin GroEL (HSP60 family)
MAHRQVLFRSAAREKILRGTAQLAHAVHVTLGPRSKSVLIEKKGVRLSYATMASRSPRNSISKIPRRISVLECIARRRRRPATWSEVS